MTLPWYLWGAGARAFGLHSKLDRVRCTECGRWTRTPAFYPLGRVLDPRCHAPLVEKARIWAATLTDHERSAP